MNTQNLYNLNDLIEMIGEGDGLQMLLKIFLESTPKILTEINKNFERKDYESLSGNAHKLKASLDMMKIISLHDVIRQIDKYEKIIANKERLDSIIYQINTTLHEVFIQLRKEPLLQDQA